MKEINTSQLIEISNRFKNHHITAFSAQMAFFLFLSIFPFTMFLLLLTSRLNLDIDSFIYNLPTESRSAIINMINNYLLNDSISLISVSGLAALWSSSRGVNALMIAFNIAYGFDETRNFIRLKLTAVFYTLILVISIIVTLALPSIGNGFFNFIDNFIPVSPFFVDLFYSIRLLLNIAVFVFFILSMHKVLPSGNLKYKDTLFGALFSIVGWFALSRSFGFFVKTFTNYSAVYGGLASIITLMMWLYFMSVLLMLGAEINSTIISFKNREYPFNQNIFKT